MDAHITKGKQTTPTIDSSKKISWLVKIAKFLIFLGVFGGLVGFYPSAFLSGVFFKAGLIYIGIITAFVLTLLYILKTNEIILPNNIFQYVLPILFVSYLISALLSPSSSASLLGHGFEIGTLGFMTVMILLVYLVTTLLRKKKYISIFNSLLFLVAIFLCIVQLIMIFSPNLFGLSGLLNSPIANFVGNINDLGIVFGATLILSMAFIDVSPLGKISKYITYALAIMSFLMLVFVGFGGLWVAIALISLASFIVMYLSRKKDTSKRKFTNASFVVLVLSVIFILFGTTISNQLYSALGVSAVELYPPTISQTLPVVAESFKDNALFGVGPNRFSAEWGMHKPIEINNGLLWSVDYNYGNSIFLTSIVTTGLVGALAWLVMYALLIFMGVKYVILKKKEEEVSSISYPSFMLALFLWAVLFVHIPSSGLMALIFMATGMFLVSLYVTGVLNLKVYNLDSKPNASFPIVLALTLLLILGVAFDYVVGAKVYASVSYQKALVELNENDFLEAENYMQKAISFGGSDTYQRGLSTVYLKELQVRAPELTNNPTEAKIQESRELASKATNAAEQARIIDASNYQNYVILGNVLRLFVSGKNDQTYTTANASFRKALELNPTNPAILLSLANLEIIRGDNEKAVEYLAKALELKPNYTQARFAWAQLQISQGNLDNAIDVLEDAVLVSPRDAGVLFQLGLLKFENKDYTGSIETLERVLQLIPEHANARYYMALSLSALDRSNEALSLLEQIRYTNPNNALLEQTIESIKKPEQEQIDTSIEDLEELPIDENSSDEQEN